METTPILPCKSVQKKLNLNAKIKTSLSLLAINACVINSLSAGDMLLNLTLTSDKMNVLFNYDLNGTWGSSTAWTALSSDLVGTSNGTHPYLLSNPQADQNGLEINLNIDSAAYGVLDNGFWHSSEVHTTQSSPSIASQLTGLLSTSGGTVRLKEGVIVIGKEDLTAWFETLSANFDNAILYSVDGDRIIFGVKTGIWGDVVDIGLGVEKAGDRYIVKYGRGSWEFSGENESWETVEDLQKDIVSIHEQSTVIQSSIGSAVKMTLNGSHHRLISDNPIGEKGWHTYATADFARDSNVDTSSAVGEIGASRDIFKSAYANRMRLGLGVGHSNLDSDLSNGGGSNVKGDFIVSELNYQLDNSGLTFSALGLYNSFSADVKRSASVTGETGGSAAALRIRADWRDLWEDKKLSLTPRLAWTGTQTSIDAYSDSDGANFDKLDSFDQELRLGADLDFDLNTKTDIRFMAELVKRFADNETYTGDLKGGKFAIESEDRDANNTFWGRLGVECSHQVFNNQIVRASVFGSTEGSDSTISGAISYNVAF